MEKKSYAYRISVGEPERKRPLGRLRRKGVNNIKMEYAFEAVYRTINSESKQDRH
jgi:hypothetical protein